MSEINTLLAHLQLKFNIEHPSLEECYAYGYECAKAQIPEEENPYTPRTSESEQWLEGWWAGFYDEEPLYANDPEQAQPVYTVLDEHAANDVQYDERSNGLLTRVLEITGLIVVSAFIGYQLIEMVA